MPANGAASRPKVLIVDDNEVTRAVARETLEDGGFDVVELASPIGLSSVVSLEKPDVLLMDVEMPGMEGDKAVSIMQKHRLHSCKILLYSSRAPAELGKLTRACGADGYVHKTMTDSALVMRVRSYVAT